MDRPVGDREIKLKRYIELGRSKRSPSGKTKIWPVMQIGVEGFRLKLGEIRWQASWRRYAFFPEIQTVYDSSCMRTLADYCDYKTQDHREALALTRTARIALSTWRSEVNMTGRS